MDPLSDSSQQVTAPIATPEELVDEHHAPGYSNKNRPENSTMQSPYERSNYPSECSKYDRSFVDRLMDIFSLMMLLCGFSLFHGMIPSILVSQLTTLEKVFGFTSTVAGLVVASYEVGFMITVIFMAFFVKRQHASRVLAVSSILFGLCGIGFSLLQLLIQPKKPVVDLTRNTSNLCGVDNKSIMNPGGESDYEWALPYALFGLVTMISGVVSTPLWTMALTFIDNTIMCPRKSAILIGKSVVTSLPYNYLLHHCVQIAVKIVWRAGIGGSD